MRGFAAVIVLFFHISVLRHGPAIFDRVYLAVDLFYIISGFVLAAVFESGVGATAAARSLILNRIGRLWPMMACGSAFGLCWMMMRDGTVPPLALLVTGLLFVPVTTGVGEIFPLNGPQWSLLSELLANIVHALVLRRLPTTALIAIASTGWMLEVLISAVQETLNVGHQGTTCFLGLSRVLFGYTAGVILARTRDLWQSRAAVPAGWIAAPLLLVACLLVPTLCAWPAGKTDAYVVLLFVPIVAIASSSDVPPLLRPGSTWLGKISYPLYAVHYPVLSMAALIEARVPATFDLALWIASVLVVVALADVFSRTPLARGIRPTGAPRRTRGFAPAPR
ncbi:acyltransferase family protein [Novosphingobium huizhouense]|uniref:acyltransferase family protein n=1 Tax=Novosphingobium huizhouense TaxID=2866625 RepID=UPI001CD8B4A4|nr:acyltransferase [Novosphingobium huizhouense]